MKTRFINFEVGTKVKMEIYHILVEMCRDKSLKIFKFLETYEGTMSSQIALLKTKVDLYYTQLTQKLGSDTSFNTKVSIPWESFINIKEVPFIETGGDWDSPSTKTY